VGALPNDETFMSLAVSILMDINEEWLTGRKYLTMDMK
jgi:putative transposase